VTVAWRHEGGQVEGDPRLQRLLDDRDIYATLCRYARGCDRGDWDLVRSAYHPDAIDDHGSFCGGVDELIDWLAARFAGIDNSTHLLGNCLIEAADDDHALAETYFISSRVVDQDSDGTRRLRQSWGRYIDQFERRGDEWRIAHRVVVLDSAFTLPVSDGRRTDTARWGSRSEHDPLYRQREALFGLDLSG
jgi:SnoaL-like domain